MPLDAGKQKIKAGARNLAPLKPLSELKDRGERAYADSTLGQIIQQLHADTANQNTEQKREIVEIGRLSAALRASKNVEAVRDPIRGAIALIKPLPRKGRKLHMVPLAQVNSSNLTAIWQASKPSIRVRHFGDTNRAVIQHAIIEQVIGHYQREIFTEIFEQRESLSMMDYGCAVIRPFYDHRLNRLSELKPIVENRRRVLFESYGMCAGCGHEGKAEDFERKDLPGMPMCPECGSPNIPALTPAQDFDFDEITGVEEISQGDISAELLAIPGCNWDMRVFVHESPWFHYKSEVSARVVESILGIEIHREDPDSDIHLQVLNAIGRRGGSVEGLGRDSLGESAQRANLPVTVLHEEHYLPECYAGLKLGKAEKTVSGETIPANVPLEEIFPDGLGVMGFNEMRVIAGVFAEKRREIGTVYHIQSHSGLGKGTSDAIETSRDLNIAHSAALETIKRFGAGGGIAYDRNAVTQKEVQAFLRPGGVVGLDLSKTNYTNINQAIWQMQNVEANQSNMAMVAQLTNLLNICFQTTDFTSGVADNRVNVDTLGGQQLLAAQNRLRAMSPLSVKGWGRARLMEQIIELFVETQQIPRFFGSGDKFAITRGRFIGAEDLPENVKCDFVPDSEIPTNEFEKREATKMMLENSKFFGGSFLDIIQVNPRIAVWWAHKFGVDDMPLFNQTELLIVCQSRIDELAELSEQADMIAQLSGAYFPPEQTGAELVRQLRRKVFPFEENHGLKATLLQEYLDDDQVQSWSATMQAAVMALIETHMTMDRDAQLRPAMLQQQGQLALQAQAAQVSQAMAAPQQAQEAEQAVQGEMLNRAAGLIEAEEQFSREQEGRDLDHRRAMELEALRQSNQPRTREK
ncbi:MAG TPA: hypothetical protein PKO33_00045 [Pyrinomonadaceae bacterium]|nr:hypothetical protein [Pyrinomonadaceae bacterium]